MKKTVLGILKFTNFILITLAFALAWIFYYSKNNIYVADKMSDLVAILIYFVIYTYFVNLYDGAEVSLFRISDIFY